MRSRSLIMLATALLRVGSIHATSSNREERAQAPDRRTGRTAARRRVLRVTSLGLLAALLIVAPVSATQPQMERIELDDLFVNPFLSEACGVEVTMRLTGHLTFRLFTDADGNPVGEVDNYIIHIRSWSVNGEIHANNVHLDRVTYLDDGSVVIVMAGNHDSASTPGEGRFFSDVGRSMLVIDADGNETLTPLGGQHDTDLVAAACSILGN
jgi:hypothetical protein